MNCEKCGSEMLHGANNCPNCGAPVGVVGKTGDTLEQAGEKSIEVGKKVGKGAVRIGGKALSGVGSLAKKGGKKLQDIGAEKKEE